MVKTIYFFLSLMTVPLLVYADCAEKEGNTFELKQCLQAEYEKADKELNAVYSQLMAKLDAEGKEKLKKAQRAWIQFRDANAQMSADQNRGGTFAGVAQLGALGDLTNKRVKELKEQLDQTSPFDQFWSEFKTTVASNDKAKVASMVDFPACCAEFDVKDQPGFLSKYDAILSPAARQAIATQRPMPFESEGIYSIRYGAEGGQWMMSFKKIGSQFKVIHVGHMGD